MVNTPPPLLGLHHITAITGDAQANLDFYTKTLGLTLVKVTVNFDDPGSYHLYYGDEQGSPGSIVTFFAWPGAKPGVVGKGQPTSIFVPAGTQAQRDPEGIVLKPGSVQLQSTDPDATRRFVDAAGIGALVEITPTQGPGRLGAGIIHHVAFRTENAETQLAWRDHPTASGFNVSPVMDRDYFTSIYFREPGGVLFEIATDGPGFGVDEDHPGTALKLPAMYEPHRAKIEAQLPRLTLPDGSVLP